MQQLQLHLSGAERIAMDPIVEEQLVEWIAEILLAVTAREREEREAGDDRES